MRFLKPKRRTEPLEFNTPPPDLGEKVGAKEAPKYLSEFRFAQTLIPLEGGQLRLCLSKPLVLQVTPDLKFSVTDWGIEMDCLDLPKLPREVARRFLLLLNQAENEQLSEADQADWLRISDYVDFRQFSADRSPPRYQEGQLLRNNDKCIVRWHDGSEETLLQTTVRALADVNVGERFGAYVKLGLGDEVIGIGRVTLLAPANHLGEGDTTTCPKTD